MAGQSEESIPALDRTDELPVLSDDSIRRLERANRVSAATAMDELDVSVDKLRAALEHAESRWQRLESRLKVQDRAIHDLNASLGGALTRMPVVPELTDIVSVADAGPGPDSARAAERAGEAAADDDVIAGRAIRAFLERIADLEGYIAGRGDRWRAMEAEVEEQKMRIGELEHELAQRIAREELLNQRLHEEATRGEGLQEKLLRLKRQRDARHDRPTRE
jgi:chromosome segregation ATPase